MSVGPSPIPRCRSPNVVPVETRRRRRLWKGGQTATDQRDRHGEPRLQSVSNFRSSFTGCARSTSCEEGAQKRSSPASVFVTPPCFAPRQVRTRRVLTYDQSARHASAIGLQTLATIRVAPFFKSRLFRSSCEGADGGSEMPNHRRLTWPGMRCVVTQL